MIGIYSYFPASFLSTPCGTDPLGSESFTLATTFDATGRVVARSWPDGDVTGTAANPMKYDRAGRLRYVPGAVSSLTYDAAGRTLKAIYPNGVTSTFTYDLWRGWLTAVSHTEAGTEFDRRDYGHDPGGRITRIDAATSGDGWTYSYDRLDRLTKATNLDVPSRTQNFAYDLGSRFTAVTGNGTYTYDAAPRRPTVRISSA